MTSASASAAAVLGEIASWGAYFEVDVSSGDDPPDAGGWEPIASAVAADALRVRIDGTRAALAGTARSPQAVPLRVAASVTHLGLLTRLLSPRIGAAALGLLLSTDVRDDRWIPGSGSGFALAVAAPEPRAVDAWSALPHARREAWTEAALSGVADRVSAAIDAVERLPPQVRDGNVVSAIHGSLAAAAWTRGGRPDRRHLACVEDLLASAVLASRWHGRVGDASFRRVSCCLIYRASDPPVPTHVCGDCILRR